MRSRRATDWRAEDVEAFRASGRRNCKTDQRLTHPSVKALIELLAQSAEAGALIENLAGIHERFTELDSTLGSAAGGA